MAGTPNIQEIIDELSYQDINMYVIYATTTLYICDYFSTFYEEVAYIWPNTWTLGKILFLLSRYHTVVMLITSHLHLVAVFGNWDPKSQYRFMVLDNVHGVVSNSLQTAIFLLGIYALFGARKAYKIALSVAYIVMLAFSSTLMANHVAMTKPESSVPITIYRIIGNYWVLARELCLLLLGGIALYTRHKPMQDSPRRILRSLSLLDIIRRDGLFWFCPMILLTLWAAISYMPHFPVIVKKYSFAGEFQAIFGPIFANRLVIDLRKSASVPTEDSIQLTSTLHFARTTPNLTETDTCVADSMEAGSRK